eukprot:GDKI01024683.1.p1 GENE.GDKI01024683.1~~GDKI01024683.1.p1  ORF type:complete len:135 (+),score=31.04 GDKI01024683.1:52-456(+)
MHKGTHTHTRRHVAQLHAHTCGSWSETHIQSQYTHTLMHLHECTHAHPRNQINTIARLHSLHTVTSAHTSMYALTHSDTATHTRSHARAYAHTHTHGHRGSVELHPWTCTYECIMHACIAIDRQTASQTTKIGN